MIAALNLEPEILNELELLNPVEIPGDTLILREESYIREIPIVLDGSIRVYKTDDSGKEIVLYHIMPGQSCILSISSCLNDKQSKANAMVEKNARIIAVPAEKVREWTEKYPSWRKFVHNLYYDRLDEVLSLIDNIAFKNVDSRLISKLKSLQKKQGDTIKSTHQSIANEIGTAREVVSRLLKHLEQQGKVKLDRGEIRIIDQL